MTRGENLCLCNKDFVADGAVLTLGQAGFGAGRLDPCVNGLGVALSLNGFTLGDFLAADFADRITGVAILGAGSVLLVDHLGERMVVLPLGIKSGVLRQGDLGAIRIGVASTVSRRIPVQEIVAFTGEGVCSQLRVGLFEHGLRKHRTLDRVFRTSVGFKGNRQLHRLFAAPNAIDIVDGVASLGVLRLGVGAVGVVQLGGSNGDLMCLHTGTALRVLMCRGLLAGVTLLVIDTGTGAGTNIRTAGGGVDAADGGQCTVNIYFCVK